MRDQTYQHPCADLPGVFLGTVFWPTLRWTSLEVRAKNAQRKVTPWGDQRQLPKRT